MYCQENSSISLCWYRPQLLHSRAAEKARRAFFFSCSTISGVFSSPLAQKREARIPGNWGSPQGGAERRLLWRPSTMLFFSIVLDSNHVTRSNLLCSGLLWACVLRATASVRAQNDDSPREKAAARQLFEEGVVAAQNGEWVRAKRAFRKVVCHCASIFYAAQPRWCRSANKPTCGKRRALSLIYKTITHRSRSKRTRRASQKSARACGSPDAGIARTHKESRTRRYHHTRWRNDKTCLTRR